MGQQLQNVPRDESGLLRDPHDWSPQLARELAREDGIEELSEEHWRLIESLRNYYAKYHVPPSSTRISHDTHLTAEATHHLFPNCLEAWRIAGLPDPGEEAKAYLSAE